MSSWTAHQHRNPRSTEPGTDFYCPIGTPVLAPDDGVIYGYGNSIAPATGRWVGIQFQSGMSFRAMHFSRVVKTSGVVRRGEIIGYSGASGYGVEDWSSNPNTGGAHTHVTLWPTAVRRYGYSPVTGKPYTIDFMNFVGGAAGGGTTPEDDMPDMNEFLNTPAYTGGPTISALFKGLDVAMPNRVWDEPYVDRGLDANGQPIHVSVKQELANVNNRLIAMAAAGGAVVDEAALASALAPLLSANIGSLSDEDIQKVAKASADEQARRMTA
jgi:murein DD-endopeptidase MepM/ murein hydrolase activator NlpD